MFKPVHTSLGWHAEVGSVDLGSQVGPENLPNLVHVHQVHAAKVIHVNGSMSPTQQADGLVTAQASLTLAVKTADCVPLHIWDTQKISMVHAGWRGTKAGIVHNALKHFTQKNQVFVVIGPSICATHYEVGPDLYQPWLELDKDLESCLTGGVGDRKFLDLKGFIRSQLMKAGILSDHIFVIDLCTFDSELPSYRREAHKAARLYNYIRRNKKGNRY